jgi:hypothetical protein
VAKAEATQAGTHRLKPVANEDRSAMNDLDTLYARLLHFGFIFLQNAADSKDQDWLNAQLEMLQNVPSLIGESNTHRHQYYWTQERQTYIDWASAPGREAARSRMLTYFEPIWLEMEPLIVELCTTRASASPS